MAERLSTVPVPPIRTHEYPVSHTDLKQQLEDMGMPSHKAGG